MKFFSTLRLFLSILGVLVLHQFVVLLYTLGVAIGYGIDNVDAFNEGAITEAMLGEVVFAQAPNERGAVQISHCDLRFASPHSATS